MKAISCAGSVDNLIVLDQETYKSRVHDVGTAADVNLGSTFKWKAGELEFESLMRMLDNMVSSNNKSNFIINKYSDFYIHIFQFINIAFL